MDKLLNSQFHSVIDDENAEQFDMDTKIGGYDFKTGEFAFEEGDEFSDIYQNFMQNYVPFVPLFITNQLVKYSYPIPNVEEVEKEKWKEVASTLYAQGDVVASIVFLENYVAKAIQSLEEQQPEEKERLENEIANSCFKLSQCCAETDDSRALDMYVTQCQKYNPSHLENLLQLILRDINSPQFSATFKLPLGNFIKWISLHPSYNQYKEQVEFMEDKPEEMVAFFEQLHSTYPKDESLCYVLALLYNGLNQLDESVAMFKKLTDINPYHYTAWNKIAASHCNNDNYESALECCDKALSLRPTYVRAISNKAIAFYQMENYEAALQHFVKALELYPVESNDSWDTTLTCAFKLFEDKTENMDDLLEQYDSIRYNLPLFKQWVKTLLGAVSNKK